MFIDAFLQWRAQLLEARLHGKLGVSFRDHKELEQAQSHFEAQQKLMKQIGDAPGTARACDRLGNVLYDLRNYSQVRVIHSHVCGTVIRCQVFTDLTFAGAGYVFGAS